jgi:DNA-binding beta-propeller fold protein YncE
MSLIQIASIELPEHVKVGGFDHAAIHFSSNRLYVAHTVNDSLDIIDCSADRYISTLTGLIGVAGVLVSEEHGLVITSNRGEDTVSIFTPGAEEHMIKIHVGIRPNGLSFDPLRGLLLVANVGDPHHPESATLSMVDIQKRKMICSIPVPGRTRWTIFDPTTDKFYTNIAEPPQIIGVASDQPDHIIRSMQITAAGPHGLDLDSRTRRLFCACDEGKLITLEAANGKMLSTADLTGKPDVIFFNPKLKHLYVAVGDPGVIDVFDSDRYIRLETVPTEKGAHTLAFDPGLNKVYAFAPQTHQALVFLDD